MDKTKIQRFLENYLEQNLDDYISSIETVSENDEKYSVTVTYPPQDTGTDGMSETDVENKERSYVYGIDLKNNVVYNLGCMYCFKKMENFEEFSCDECKISYVDEDDCF